MERGTPAAQQLAAKGPTQHKRCVNVDCEGLVTPPKPRGTSKRDRCRPCYNEYRASYKSENQVELVAEASKPRTREASKRQRDPQSTPQTSGNTTALLADTGGKRIRQVLPVIEEVQQQPPGLAIDDLVQVYCTTAEPTDLDVMATRIAQAACFEVLMQEDIDEMPNGELRTLLLETVKFDFILSGYSSNRCEPPLKYYLVKVL